ncbi:hypothetical protein V1477_017872 [Vespula maculifrons]|uniref:Uncharacterized protein n=1 Tax=Vespula maculifrons TaxID=7453 RepID=A0ABD2AZN2_VESMC
MRIGKLDRRCLDFKKNIYILFNIIYTNENIKFSIKTFLICYSKECQTTLDTGVATCQRKTAENRLRLYYLWVSWIVDEAVKVHLSNIGYDPNSYKFYPRPQWDKLVNVVSGPFTDFKKLLNYLIG